MYLNLILVIILSWFSVPVTSKSVSDDGDHDKLGDLTMKTYALETSIAGMKTEVCALELKMKEKKELLQNQLDQAITNVTNLMKLVEGQSADQAAMRVDIDALVNRLDSQLPVPVPDDHQHYTCPSMWEEHNGQCFYFSTDGDLIDWNTAKFRCLHHGAHLAVVDTEELNTYMKIRLRRSEGNSHFVGGFDFGQSEWIWDHTNTALVYTDWRPNQPSGGRDEHCLHICSSSSCQWNDVDCYYDSKYICQKDAVLG